jgi:hypothetical protein
MSIAEWRRCGFRAKDLQPRIDDNARVMATPGPDVARQAADRQGIQSFSAVFAAWREDLSATPRVCCAGDESAELPARQVPMSHAKPRRSPSYSVLLGGLRGIA